MTRHRPGPPRIAERLLQLVLRATEAEFLLGDLAEDFTRWHAEHGLREARRRYRRHALATGLGRSAAALRTLATEAVRSLGVAARGLRNAPGFTAAAALTLALGLGGVTSVLALTQSLLRPLPFPDAERLVAVWETRDGERRWVAPANYLDWRRELTSFDGLAAHDERAVSLTIGGEAHRARVAMVSGNFFDVLGVSLPLGGLDPAFDPNYPDRVAVLSHETWRDRFGADPAVLGRSFRVEEQTYTVVGVAPPGLAFPGPGLAAWLRSRYEAPELGAAAGDIRNMRDAWYFQVVGRLSPGASTVRAGDELRTLSARLEDRHPETNTGHRAEVVPLLEQTVADARPILAALAAAVGLLLAAALVNVVHLVLGRAVARRADFGVRRALGAGRLHLLAHLMVEGALLGLLGALVGLPLATLGIEAGVTTLEGTVPRLEEIALRPSVAVLATAASIGLGVLVTLLGTILDGRAPRRSARIDTRQGSGSAGRWLVAAQVAAAVALLSSSAVLVRSLQELAAVDVGFAAEDVALVSVAQPTARQRPYVERLQAYEELRARVAELPGATAASYALSHPMDMGMRAGLRVEGWSGDGEPGDVGWMPVHPDFFDTYGIGLVEGRVFSPLDGPGSEDVAVVNAALVRQVFGSAPAIGRTVSIGLDGHDRPLTIVGVVDDTRSRGPALPAGAVLYRPMAQTDRFSAEAVTLAVRVPGAGSRDLGAIQSTLREVRPDLPVYGPRLGPELVGAFSATRTALLRVLGLFSVVALLLGTVGVYGVAAWSVRRQRREIGVRMALGADRGRVLAGVLTDGIGRALWGLPAGAALAALSSRGLESVLYGVDPIDAVSIGVASVLVVGATALALLGPAVAAARIDPARATREG